MKFSETGARWQRLPYADHDVTVVDLTEEELAEFRAYGEQVVLEQERGDEVLAAIKAVEDSLG